MSLNDIFQPQGDKGAEAAASAPEAGERMRYAAGGLRQTILALGLLLVLPFAAGALYMAARRAMDGVHVDLVGVLIVAAGLLAAVVMLGLELLHATWARLKFGKSALSFTLPANGGPTPKLRYVSAHIPYHAIKSVELRREVYGGKLAPVLLRGLVLRTKDNREFVLGHTLDGFEDPAFPFDEIGERIARRCALPLMDQRTVWRRTRKERAAGYISDYDTQNYILDPSEIARLNVAHGRLVFGIASALAALVILGILADLSS